MEQSAIRTSLVGQVFVGSLTGSSAMFTGDMVEFAPTTEALAIQREVPNFYGDEGDLTHFSIFTAEIPSPLKIPLTELTIRQESPFIRVGSVHLTAISTSALFHIGKNRSIRAESRIKHIRQLLTGERAIV